MTASKITPAVYRFLLELLADKLLRVDGSSFWHMPSGTAGTRVANATARLGVITLHDWQIATVDKPKIRELVRQHDLRTLPHGVKITSGYSVLHNGRKIGEVSRTGAGRGGKVRYFGRAEQDGLEIDVPGSFDERWQAGRAICKALGMALPGEAVAS